MWLHHLISNPQLPPVMHLHMPEIGLPEEHMLWPLRLGVVAAADSNDDEDEGIDCDDEATCVSCYRYVMSTLELLVVQEYMIVYFHSATSSRRKLPGIRWFKRCYDMIDRR